MRSSLVREVGEVMNRNVMNRNVMNKVLTMKV